jgi:hypothetical protein
MSQNVAPLPTPAGEGKGKRAAEATRIYPLWSVTQVLHTANTPPSLLR